jgi:predicted nucleic acid-binding protein
MAGRTEGTREVYVDTSGLIAFLDKSDSHHPLYRRLFSQPPPLVTSALVIAEGHGWFLLRYDGRRATQFLGFVEELPGLRIEAFDQLQIAQVRSLVLRFADQPLTLADVHGLAIMDQRRIRTCWSTDRHLGLCGATLVR